MTRAASSPLSTSDKFYGLAEGRDLSTFPALASVAGQFKSAYSILVWGGFQNITETDFWKTANAAKPVEQEAIRDLFTVIPPRFRSLTNF